MQEENVQPAPVEEGIAIGNGERIFLVDDEPFVAETIGKMLERLGYRVTIFPGGIEALDVFHSALENFDLVITDLTMAGMTGIQMAEELKKIHENIPILLCAGFSEQVHGERLKALGICGQLTKPVIIKTLSDKVRDALLSKT